MLCHSIFFFSDFNVVSTCVYWSAFYIYLLPIYILIITSYLDNRFSLFYQMILSFITYWLWEDLRTLCSRYDETSFVTHSLSPSFSLSWLDLVQPVLCSSHLLSLFLLSFLFACYIIQTHSKWRDYFLWHWSQQRKWDTEIF